MAELTPKNELSSRSKGWIDKFSSAQYPSSFEGENWPGVGAKTSEKLEESTWQGRAMKIVQPSQLLGIFLLMKGHKENFLEFLKNNDISNNRSVIYYQLASWCEQNSLLAETE